MSTGTLPRDGAASGKLYSRARSNQMRTELEDTWTNYNWNGVVSGGEITDNGGVSILVGAGTYVSEGVSHVEASTTTYNSLPSSGTSTVWGRVNRTAASQDNKDDEDTYDLGISHTTDDSSPGVGYFRLGYVVTASGDILSINNGGSGKRPLHLDPCFDGSTSVASGQAGSVPSGKTYVKYGTFTVTGTVGIFGRLVILG